MIRYTTAFRLGFRNYFTPALVFDWPIVNRLDESLAKPEVDS